MDEVYMRTPEARLEFKKLKSGDAATLSSWGLWVILPPMRYKRVLIDQLVL